MDQHRVRREELNAFDITACSGELRKLPKLVTTLEEFAQLSTKLLFDKQTTKPDALKACALVRFFRTVDFQDLEPRLQASLLKNHTGIRNTDKFLTLLGTSGTEPNWNDRRLSEEHQTIPLFSAEMIARSPMIARLVSQLGIEISSLLSVTSTKLEFKNPADRDYNIFHVADARNSAFIPAQESFVKPFNIRSVVGFGSLLPDNNFYAVVMFYKVPVLDELLKKFTTLALSTTIAVLTLPPSQIFSHDGDPAK